MSVRESAIKAIGKGFDIERRVKGSPVDRIALLARDGRTRAYRELRAYDKGFILRYNGFRDRSIIEIATTDNLLEHVVDLVAVAVVYGTTGVIHAATGADLTPPDDRRFTWMISGEVRPTESYTASEEN